MNEYYSESIKLLEKFDDNEAKDSLKKLVEFVVKRKK